MLGPRNRSTSSHAGDAWRPMSCSPARVYARHSVRSGGEELMRPTARKTKPGDDLIEYKKRAGLRRDASQPFKESVDGRYASHVPGLSFP